MLGIIDFKTFLLTGILLILTPGTDTMFIISQSLSRGRKAGILSALGISFGTLIHTTFATLGLSIIIAQSAIAFATIKYLGACYLIYLGIVLLFSRRHESIVVKRDSPTSTKIFLSGALTNILNPKVALFFLAFLPQFIDPAYPNTKVSFIILGLTFVTAGAIWCLMLALFSAKLSRYMTGNNKTKDWLNKISGLVFIFLGIKLGLLEK